MSGSPTVEVRVVSGPVVGAAGSGAPAGCGALLVFEGVVRPDEGGQRIDALVYEAYEPMAQRTIEAIARELAQRHGLALVRVEHSKGRVPAGECSFRLTVAAAHRREALAAADEFIDRLKRDVPIWKAPAG